MTKSEIVQVISENVQMSKGDVEAVIDGFLNHLTEALKEQQSVRLIGFGTFSSRLRKAFEARNPKTGDPVDVKPSYVPVFKPGKTLKMALASVPVEKASAPAGKTSAGK